MADRAKAVAVAKDVLKYVGSLKLSTNSYLGYYWEDTPGELMRKVAEASDLQEVVNDIAPYCRVCAVGACLLSKARLFDNVPRERFFDSQGRSKWSWDVHQYLDDIFSPTMLRLIECGFMVSDEFATDDMNDFPEDDEGYFVYSEEVCDAVAFGARFDDMTDRIRAIMENVIANAGAFVPPRREEVVSC